MPKAALIQMVSSSRLDDNLNQIAHWLTHAKELNVDLVVLPEHFALMGNSDQDKYAYAEHDGVGPIQEHVRQLAKKLNLWIIAGTIPIKTRGTKVRSSCFVYDNQGLRVARYDKIHLFDVHVSKDEAHQESFFFERGDEVVVVDTPIGKVGLTVCYDVRFAELYQQLRLKGAEVFSVSSAFTAVTGRAHWEVLLRARAIENLCYVLAPNQGGHHENGRKTYGHSMIIEPWGEILAQKQSGAGLIVADIDLARLYALRHQFPCLEHHVLNEKV